MKSHTIIKILNNLLETKFKKVDIKSIFNWQSGQISDYAIDKDDKIVGLHIERFDLSILFVKIFENEELCKTLTQIDLSRNNITNLTNLNNCKNLISIDLQNNNIVDISFLQTLINLKKLNLSHNNIKNITSLKYLENLEYLNLSNNNIKDISKIYELTKIIEIKLTDNPIKNKKIENLEKHFGIFKEKPNNTLYIENNNNNIVFQDIKSNDISIHENYCIEDENCCYEDIEINFEDNEQINSNYNKNEGVLLQNIPKKMQLNNIHRCIIRIAFNEKTIIKNLPKNLFDKIMKKGIRISESMEVLFLPNPYFEITAINSNKQIVEPNDYTEWNFDVKPLIFGSFPITFKVSIFSKKGVKETILRETISVVVEQVASAEVFIPSGLLNANTQKLDNTRIKLNTILFLSATPSDQARIQTDKEHRIIKSEMQRGKYREHYAFLPSQFAVTITELIRAMNDKPNIIHFSGHGEKKGILIANDNNEAQFVPISALKRLFRPLENTTEIVILNSCYSAEQAKEISKFKIFVVGNNLPIEDDASISFAKGLYNGLGEGKTFEDAYNDAMIVLMTENSDYAEVVEVWKNGKKLNV